MNLKWKHNRLVEEEVGLARLPSNSHLNSVAIPKHIGGLAWDIVYDIVIYTCVHTPSLIGGGYQQAS